MTTGIKLTIIPATFIITALFGCGDPEMTLSLMDAPPPGVTSVRLHIASMDVHVVDKDKAAKNSDPSDSSIDDDDKWHSLDVDSQIDLVAHQGEDAAAVLGQLSIPEGKVTQIRLHLDASQENAATKDDVDCNLDLSKVPDKGVKINHPFKAFATESGSSHEAVVDFELDKSLKASGDCFIVEPVIKLHKAKTDGEEIDISVD